MTLREWLEAVAESDAAPTAERMIRRTPRSGAQHIKTVRRTDKHTQEDS